MSISLNLYLGSYTWQFELTIWGAQQQQQFGNQVHPIKSGTDVWKVDQSWSENEAEWQWHRLSWAEGMLNFLPKTLVYVFLYEIKEVIFV